MRNTLTIMRRDLAAFYTSPIGYIFMFVFLLISVGLYMTTFFAFPVADMRAFFGNLPMLLCIFVPAVTMRVWAEERKENTWEMLLTFPAGTGELVLGKFLATLVFLILTVGSTVTVPLMLMNLGDPDLGAIFGGYLGTILLGAFFLAIGIFVSGFCRDQIVAFVITLLACFAMFLLGTQFIAAYLDGVVSGLGSVLSRVLGVIDHYQPFSRGVIETADLLYFLGWIALLLFLNVQYIDGRSRPGSKTTFATVAVLCLGVGLAFNWLIGDQNFGRFDMTKDKLYTISPASEAILSKLDTPVQLNIYITPKDKMPTMMKTLEQDVMDKLQDLKAASGNKLEFATVHLEAANIQAEVGALGDEKKDEEKGDEEKLEDRMLDKGVKPFMVRAYQDEEVTQKAVYSSIGVAYRDKKEEILPQIMPETLPELEYRLVSTIYKLTQEKPPVVALVAPKEQVKIDPQMRRLYEQMGQQIPQSDDPYMYLERLLSLEKYKVERVDLTKESPLPKEYDTLVVVNPRELNDRQRWEINRALVAGKSVVMAVQNYEWDYQATRRSIQLSRREEKPNINDLLKEYGLGVSTDILMDVNHVPLTIGGGDPLAALLGGGQPVNTPIQILVTNENMDETTSITSHLENILYLWGSALTLDQDALAKNGLEAKVLMNTTDKAWSVSKDTPLSGDSFNPPKSGKQFPLMAMVRGQFPDAYKDKARPAWASAPPQPGMPPEPQANEPEAEAEPVTPAEGQLILLGCSQMFRKDFLQEGNLDLFLNAVDAVTLDSALVNLRGKKPIERTITKPSDTARRVWKFVNYGAMNLVIAGVGIGVLVVRRRGRRAYLAAYQAMRQAGRPRVAVN